MGSSNIGWTGAHQCIGGVCGVCVCVCVCVCLCVCVCVCVQCYICPTLDPVHCIAWHNHAGVHTASGFDSQCISPGSADQSVLENLCLDVTDQQVSAQQMHAVVCGCSSELTQRCAPQTGHAAQNGPIGWCRPQRAGSSCSCTARS